MAGSGSIHLHIDASAFGELSRALDRLPGRMREQVVGRALRRARSTAMTGVVRRTAERVSVPTGIVRRRMRVLSGDAASVGMAIRSRWIPLHEFGARQTRRGVTVRGRGSYRSAFMAQAGGSSRLVFRRVGDSRLPIKALFGPNPASDVVNSPAVYLDVLANVMDEAFGRRILHEITRLLPAST